MQTSTEYLKQILHVVSSIDQTMKREAGSPTSSSGTAESGPSIFKGIGSQLKQMFSVNYKGSKNFLGFSQKLIDLAEKTPDKNIEKLKVLTSSFEGLAISLPKLSEGLESLGNLKEKRVNRAVSNLMRLYEFLDKVGDGRKVRKIERAIKMFEKLGKSLREVARPIKTISMSLINLSLGIVAFAGSIVLAGKILGLAGGSSVFNFIIVSILGMAMVFGVLALSNRIVDKGTNTVRKMGIGMTFLAIGVISFALAIAIVPAILGIGGNAVAGVLAVGGILVFASLIFAGMGLLAGPITKGVAVAASMGIGMMFLAAGVMVMALAARGITAMQGDGEALNKKGEKRGKFGQMMATIGPGLGVMGIVLVSSALLFAGLGLLAPVLLPGIGVGMALSLALILFSVSVKKLVKTANELGTKEEIHESVEKTIGGVLGGFLDGIKVLAGGKKGFKGIKEFIKNSAAIFAGTTVLLSISLALSQFAKGLTAFAEFENMRVIEGYDKEGRPKFGEKINIRDVSDNISYSISTFLESILESTEGLTRKKAGAIKKMARALTGRRGILSGTIQFASALKTYAEFGESNEIGYVDYDDEGNEIRKKVKASVVVDNIIGSFLYFTNQLFSRTEQEFGDGEPGISGRERRRMKRMSKALVGKHGVLGAVMQFSETLGLFSQYGNNNSLPILDEDGRPTGKSITVDTIANNIVKTLTTFSDTLASKLEKGKVKDAGKALEKYDNMIGKLSKLSSSMDGVSKLALTTQNLADSIGDLAVNLDALDTDKLGILADKINTGGYVPASSAEASKNRSNSRSKDSTRSSGSISKTESPNWDLIAAQIGESVGSQIVNAMKSQQMKFQFSSSGGNQGVIEFD